MTPEQMRTLANEPEYPFTDETVEWQERMRFALRAAADQLEAVQQYVLAGEYECEEGPDKGGRFVWTYSLRKLLGLPTADTAPQDVAPAKRMLMTHPHDGHGSDDTCRDCEAEQ